MSLNHLLSTVPENRFLNIGCHDEIVYGDLEVKGSFIAPDLKVDSVHTLDGTKDLPSYSFQSEVNSGLYKSAANQLRVSVNGVDTLRIKEFGLGILTNQDAPLSVKCPEVSNNNIISNFKNGDDDSVIQIIDANSRLSQGPLLQFVSNDPSRIETTGNALNINVGGQPGLVVQKDATFLSSVVAGAQVTLAGNSTQGFFYLPPINGGGAPTGVPQVFGNSSPITVDPVTNKLWVYCATGWKSATLS